MRRSSTNRECCRSHRFRAEWPFARASLSRTRASAAFTLIEAAVAGALMTLFITSLFSLNSSAMRMLRSAAEAANASQSLQTRVEQVRLANWGQITSASWVQTNLLGMKTDASVNLPGMVETLTVSPYVSPSSTAPASLPAGFTVTRDENGQATTSTSGYSIALLSQQEMLRVDLSVTWPSWGRNRTRSLTTLVSHWGVSK